MTHSRANHDALVGRLREHGEAWEVTADTPDAEVFNETSMARDCCRAADALAHLTRERDELIGALAELFRVEHMTHEEIERLPGYRYELDTAWDAARTLLSKHGSP